MARPTDWKLCRADRSFRRPPPTASLSPLLEGWEALDELEEQLGIPDGQPFLLDPSGQPDVDVLLYVNSSSFRSLATESQLSYAKDLKVYLSFLSLKGVDWRDATENDLLDYEFWRRRDERNERRVGGAKFSRELAACRRFYDWQVRRGTVARSPVTLKNIRRRDGSEGQIAALQPRNARNTRVKWLTPRAYRRWRDVGLGGYDASGLRDPSWRGRNDGRNVAFAELLWGSGLRLREGATLLDVELPEMAGDARFLRSRVADAVAKGSGRDFWLPRRTLQRIVAYQQTERFGAVHRAQAQGRYDELSDVLLVEGVTRRRTLLVTDEAGKRHEVALDELDAGARRRLFRTTPAGVEPVALWLGESGLPMRPATWQTVFLFADRRCANLQVPVRCHPHMLRHSFALRMLVTLTHAFDRRLGLTPEERREYRLLFGDPFVLVQTMLGHRSVETTRDIYLEPVQGLHVELFLNSVEGDDESIDGLLSRIAADAPQVNDGGASGN